MSEMIQFRLLYITVALMSCIPWRAGQFMGRMLGRAISWFPHERWDVAMENIREGLGPSMDRGKRERMKRKILAHFAMVFFEIPHILRLRRDNLHRYVVIENESPFLSALRKGKGVFILTAHFGNWELMNAVLSLRFGNAAVIVRPIDFPPADRLVQTLRSRFGTELISKQRAMRRIMGALKEKKVIGILLDQNVDWNEGAFVKFLGRWACTNKGLALMVQKTGTPVIPAFSVRQEDGRYRIIFGEEVDTLRTGDRIRDVEENTARFTGIIENYIKRYPDHWFWFHRRWKTRPYCPLPDSYFAERE